MRLKIKRELPTSRETTAESATDLIRAAKKMRQMGEAFALSLITSTNSLEVP